MNIFVTGGSGFIGSALVRFLIRETSHNIFNIDKLTYAADPRSLDSIERNQRYTFIKEDIINNEKILELLMRHQPTLVFHLAAESHVDRSISNPEDFIITNVLGTLNLLNACKDTWGISDNNCFYHISTDEVYGSLGETGFFSESTSYDPRSPYSASKASSDHLVRAYGHTYSLPVKISNCSNNYGSHQFPEKLIPLIINNILNKKPLPIYGKGENIRDWLWVEDHANAIDLVFHKGKTGETYNIGGHNEWANIDLVYLLCDIMDRKLSNNEGDSRKLITYVKDRAGHDLRYAIDATKIEKELGFKPSLNFQVGLEKTVDWYLDNKSWLDDVTTGNYQNYYKQHYK